MVRDKISEEVGAAGGANALGIEEVFDGDGNAVERAAAFTAGEFFVGLFGAFAGGIDQDGLHGVGGRIEALNGAERGGGKIDRGCLAAAQGGGGFEDGQAASSGGGAAMGLKWRAGWESSGRARTSGRKSASRASRVWAMRSRAGSGMEIPLERAIFFQSFFESDFGSVILIL